MNEFGILNSLAAIDADLAKLKQALPVPPTGLSQLNQQMALIMQRMEEANRQEAASRKANAIQAAADFAEINEAALRSVRSKR